MNVVYGCYPSFFSEVIANLMIKKGIPISCIMLSTKKIKIEGKDITGLKGFLFLMKRFGCHYVGFQLFCNIVLSPFCKLLCLLKGQKLLSFKNLCSQNGIRLIKSDNFNQDINQYDNIDVFISMCLNQKLNSTFISAVKVLCINVHPSDIPNFGGVEPIIQLLLSGGSDMGITIHKMTEQIDYGDPIQREYVAVNTKSYLRLMKEFISVGVEMLESLAKKNWRTKPCESVEYKHPYRSWPTRIELELFKERFKYISFRDLWIWEI